MMSEKIEFPKGESVLHPENEADEKSMPIYKAWFLAFFYPGRKTYIRIANQSNASIKKALFWAVLVALLSSFALTDYSNWVSLKQVFFTWFVGRLWSAFFMVLVFTIAAVLVKLISDSLGGAGSFENIAYVISAIFVPYEIISVIVTKVIFSVETGHNTNLYLIFDKIGAAHKIVNLYVLFLIILVIRAIAFTDSKQEPVEESGKTVDEAEAHTQQKKKVAKPDIRANRIASTSDSFVVLSLQSFFFPNARVFQRIAALKEASLKRALLWVSIPFFIRSAIVMIYNLYFFEGSIHTLLTTGYFVGAFVLTVKLTQKIANRAGGTCNTDQLAYVLAAIAFSSIVVEGLFAFFAAIFPRVFSGVVAILLAMYIVILYGIGVAGANKIEGAGKYLRVAIGSSFVVLVFGGILLTFYACFALTRVGG